MTKPAKPDRFHPLSVERQAHLQGVALATFRSRAAAFAIDALIVGCLIASPAIWQSVTGREPGETFRLEIVFEGLLSFAVFVAYFALATYFGHGATPGKKLLGIRVVSLAHPRLSMWHCTERALGYAASSLEAGFGFIQYFTHHNRQTVHDRIAETIVVADRER